MNKSLLGMYMHMHWSYKHPYAVRTWTLEDWRAYLTGLRGLGYNLVQIWPMIDTMPYPPTPSDLNHLDKIRRVIDLAHELGMVAYVGACANTLGNDKAGNYSFEDRPYFIGERLINPAVKSEVGELIRARRVFIEPFAKADGFWMIDSDPGGYPGSSNAEFVELLDAHRRLLNEVSSGMKLFYWIWGGWENCTMKIATDPKVCWRDTLKRLADCNPEPWGLHACRLDHFEVIAELGLTSRTLYFPYNAVEGEPTFPFTNCDIDTIEKIMHQVPADGHPLGVMANAQSHCVQLPNTYLFAHFAAGGTKQDVDLAGFGNRLIPGCGDSLAMAWTALAGDDVSALNKAGKELKCIVAFKGKKQGPLCGLCFNDTERLARDLLLQIELKTVILKLREQLGKGASAVRCLKKLVNALEAWSERHGFEGRYFGPLRNLMHPVLLEASAPLAEAEAVKTALDGFDHGPVHGAFTRLMSVLKRVVSGDPLRKR